MPIKKKPVNLSIGRGEKSRTGGLTKKGIEKYTLSGYTFIVD